MGKTCFDPLRIVVLAGKGGVVLHTGTTIPYGGCSPELRGEGGGKAISRLVLYLDFGFGPPLAPSLAFKIDRWRQILLSTALHSRQERIMASPLFFGDRATLDAT